MIIDNVEKINFANSKGKYIRFNGFGLINGLEQTKKKYQFLKILEFKEDELLLKRYCSKKISYLSKHNFNQSCEIISQKEFSKLEKF